MRTPHLILASCLMLALNEATAQPWDQGGNLISSPADYLGCNGSSTFPLNLKTVANQPIDFSTADLFRARINPRITYALLGQFPNVEADGFALITPNTSFFNAVKGPFSRLHLAEGTGGNAQSIGYRPWQRNGITFTGNSDHGYIGQKYKGEDHTDMIIQWSDNPGTERPDKLRFLFTSWHDPSAPTGAESLEGLEGMRLWPKDFREVNVGVGDFFADGTDPTERLHVVNGRVRIEELPNDPEAVGLTKVVVVDDAASDEHGVLKWMDIADLVPADCEWTMSPTGFNNVSTAFGASDPDCPDMNDAVGIGVDLGSGTATAKTSIVSTAFSEGLNVAASTTGSGFIIGGRFAVNGSGTGGSSSSGTRGIAVTSNGAGPIAVGRAGDFLSYDNSQFTNGVHAETFAGTGEAAAVYGWCHSNAATNVGVYGRVDATTSGSWAGYFQGDVQITGNLWNGGTMIFSDASLKEQVEDLAASSEQLAALNPKRFRYTAQAQERMSLPSDEQLGFIAQEVESIIPELVSTTHLAPVWDTTGQEMWPAQDVKAVNYIGIIPLLVSGYQDQQQTIIDLEQRLNDLEQALANCCSIPNGSQLQEQGANSLNDLERSTSADQKLRIQPNPFSESTTVFYTLERSGRAQLMANSADGKQLRVLQEANLESGSYQYEWNTADLAAGIYYVTLLLDGQAVVKKAVKVNR